MSGMSLNLYAAWRESFLDCLAGAAPNLVSYGRHWPGGYRSEPRRTIRPDHIAFCAFKLLNLGFALISDAIDPIRNAVESVLLQDGIIPPADNGGSRYVETVCD